MRRKKGCERLTARPRVDLEGAIAGSQVEPPGGELQPPKRASADEEASGAPFKRPGGESQQRIEQVYGEFSPRSLLNQ
jgi:hypothetical protein